MTGPGSAVTGTERPRKSRWYAVMTLTVLLSAAALAGGAVMTWWSRSYLDPLGGPVSTSVSGSAMQGELLPVAALAVAGWGAAAAARGALRKAVGVILAVAGLGVMIRLFVAVSPAPVSLLAQKLDRPAQPTAGVVLNMFGPLLAGVGGLLLLVGGVMVVATRARAAAGRGTYDPPAAQRDAARRSAGAQSADTGDFWRALDAGIDPTDPGQTPPDTMASPDGTRQ